MENATRTVYNAALQTAQLFGLNDPILPHTTLNEKFNINANVQLASSDRPTIRYVGIGNGGHTTVLGVGNLPLIEPVQHRPRNAAMYNQLPFVLRTTDNDLTAPVRAQYRLRRIEVHGGINYVAYYLKVLDLSQSVVQMTYQTVTNGVATSTPFTPTIGDLNPTPPDLSNTQVLVTTGDYISASTKVPFVMSADELTEFMNVCNIIYGNPDYAIISEIAICSGIDKTVSGLFGGVSTGYTDAVGVQIASFMNVFYSARFNNSGVNVLLDVGSVEPMIAL